MRIILLVMILLLVAASVVLYIQKGTLDFFTLVPIVLLLVVYLVTKKNKV